MDIKEAMRERHSVRSYTDRPIENEKQQVIRDRMEALNRQFQLHLQLVTDEPAAFSGRLAHYGKFSQVSNYMAMVGPKGKTLDETIGYCGEQLVLLAQTLGLNTCWVGLTYRKVPEAVHIGTGEKLVCVIALGYGTSAGSTHKVKTPGQVSNADQDVPEWFRNGIEAALLAPTALNQQKFKLRLKGTRVQAKAGMGFFTKVDLGIVKYHFEVGAGPENFTWEE